MALFIVLVLGFAFGMSLPHWPMVLVPLAAGATLILALLATGRDVSDTPIPFVSVAATLAVAAGILARGRTRARAVR